jgi:hypothetical protein
MWDVSTLEISPHKYKKKRRRGAKYLRLRKVTWRSTADRSTVTRTKYKKGVHIGLHQKSCYHNLETNGPSTSRVSDTILLDIGREKRNQGVHGEGINIRQLVYA